MTAPAPLKPIGYTQTPNYNWWLYEDEPTPELQWPQSVAVYDAMRKQDSQVASVLRAVGDPVRRTAWRLDPNGARDEVVQLVSDDLGVPIVGQAPKPTPRSKGKFSWSEHLRLALLMLPMGHAYFEQLYRVDADGMRAHLAKLELRPSKTIEKIDVASDGGLISIKQYWTQLDTEPKPIPVDRLVAYIYDREGGNWLGTSVLRRCYKNWLIKDRLLRVQAQTIERNGMGVPLYTAAETETELETGRNMAQSWRSGEAAGAAIPYGADLKLRGVEGTLPDALPAIEYHDSQIARAVLAHFLNLGQQTGSWALGTTFADFFTLSLQTLAQQVADVATQHIIEDLVDINFGEDEPAPRLTFDEIGSRQAATAQALKSLVDSGVVHPDEVLEESSRQQYGLPPADPATATKPTADVTGDGTPAGAATAEPDVRPGSVAAAGDVAPKGSAAEAAVTVTAKFNPNQPRNPHTGEWLDTTPGDGLKLYTLKNLVNVYGDWMEEVGAVDVDQDGPSLFAVVRFETGDIALLLNNADKDQRYAILKDGDSDDMRDLADRLEWAATGDRDAAPVSENGLVDWTVEDDGVLVGYDPSGDVRIGFPLNPHADVEDLDPGSDDLLEFDLSGEDASEAWEVIDALREMADAQDAATGEVQASFNESLHPRNPKGSAGGGRFRSLADRILDAITEHHKGGGKGDPLDAFKGFKREQLRTAAKARGIELKRGEKEDSIAAKLLADVGPGKRKADVDKPKAPDKPKATPRKRAPRKAATPKVTPAPKPAPQRSKFDVDNAAESFDAIDAAPTRARALYEAGMAPDKRREFLAAVERMDEFQAHKVGGYGARASIGENEQITPEERSSMLDSLKAYMTEDYFAINGALHEAGQGELGADVPDEVRGYIADIDKLLNLSRINRDAIYYRGTRFEGEPPQEIFNPGYSSTSANDHVAQAFAQGEFLGQKTGSTDRPGQRYLLEIRVPKGSRGMQVSPMDVAGEVLLARGVRMQLVEERDPVDGVRHVVYELVSDGV